MCYFNVEYYTCFILKKKYMLKNVNFLTEVREYLKIPP